VTEPGGRRSPAGDLRPLLFSIAYRMLASVADAEDLVQEAYLRYERALAEGARIQSPKAYLSAVVTRLAIDELRSARARRETYSGQWLPEPLLTDDGAADPAAAAEQSDSLSMAFLLLLERLGPVERAVFLLHDVFGYEHREIAEIIGKSEANTRQIARRARRHVEAGKPRFDASREQRERLAERFFAAVSNGDVEGLVELLAEDAVVYGDGGGKAPQWSRPIVGANRVARLLAGVGRRIAEVGGRLQPREVNGQPGAVVFDRHDRVIHVLAIDVSGGAVRTIRSVINPDKLRHLGPVADVWALLRELNSP
jgi:RNA polymerase sigma-70 factor, ECF subfamily